MIHNEEAVNALERVAAEERGVAAERGALAADLALSAERLTAERAEIDRQAAWWQSRYPRDPVAPLLTERQGQAAARVDDVTARIAEVAEEQQAHEIAAAALTEDAARARAEWEAQRRADNGGQERTPADGRLVANGDRATKAHPAVASNPNNEVRMVDGNAVRVAVGLPPGVAPIDPRSVEVTAVDGASE